MSGYLSISEAELKTRIKNALGNPDTTLLADAELDEWLDWSLARINELRPRIVYGYVTTVKDQQDYLLATDRSVSDQGIENFLGLRECYWDPIRLSYFNIDEVLAVATIPLAQGLQVWESPSLVEMHFEKLKAYKMRLGGSWRVVEKTGTSSGSYLRLYPAPSNNDDKVYFEALQSRTLSDLEKQFEQIIIDLTVGQCKKLMADRVSLVKSVSVSGRKDSFDGKQLWESGDKLLKDAENRLRTSTPIIFD